MPATYQHHVYHDESRVHTVAQKVMPFTIELFAFTEIVELGSQHCFDILLVGCQNDSSS
jgi:hypothetical protein